MRIFPDMIRELMILSLGALAIAEWTMDSENLEKRSEQRYCGTHLNDVLNLVCNGRFYSPFSSPLSKKSYEYPRIEDYEENDGKTRAKFFPFRAKTKALQMLQFRRKRRGAAKECCEKSCRLSELRGYCEV